MTRVRKRSAPELSKLREHIENLQKAPWIGSSREWWPGYLFHCTDINNVVSILKSGELLSRVQVQQADSLRTDIAAPEIIASTNPRWQDYVRLYFRPRTPTQYRNEGIRPVELRELDSHCPIPVYLLFDSFSILSRQDSLFSDGNLASNPTVMSKIDELRGMPFQQIYHDSSIELEEKAEIVHRRNAEVLIPQRLGLRAVRHILCRSEAEYQTLLNLLPSGAHRRWAKKIGIITEWALFNARWTFVRQVELGEKRVIIRFNDTTVTPGPFCVRFEIQQRLTTEFRRHVLTKSEFYANDVWGISLKRLTNLQDYTARLYLDGDLAYEGRYEDYRLPF